MPKDLGQYRLFDDNQEGVVIPEASSMDEEEMNKLLDSGRGVVVSIEKELAERRIRNARKSEKRDEGQNDNHESSIVSPMNNIPEIRATERRIIPRLSAEDIKTQICNALEMIIQQDEVPRTVTLEWVDWYRAEASLLLCQTVLRTWDRVMEKLINAIRDTDQV